MLAKWISSAESSRCSLRRTLGRRRPIRQPPERSLCVNDREGGGGEGEVIGTYDKRPRGGKNPGHGRATRCQAMSRRSDKADSSLSDGLSSAKRTTCKFVERCGVFHEPDGGRRRHSRQRPCPVPVLHAARSASVSIHRHRHHSATMSGSRKFVSLGMFIIDEVAFADAAGKPTDQSIPPQGGPFLPVSCALLRLICPFL